MEFETAPHPLLLDLADELLAAVRATADGFRALMETPLNEERFGAAIDQLDAICEALQEIREQQEQE